MAAFLDVVLRGVAVRIVVIWDGPPMRKDNPVRSLLGPFIEGWVPKRLPPDAL